MKPFNGKILLTILALGLTNCQSPMLISKKEGKFPEIPTRTLAGNDMVFPQAIRGKMAFVAVVFEKGGAYQVQQNEANAWTPFYEKELKPKGVVFYEIPMMAGSYALARGWIDSGMRSGIDASKHDQVACFYGNKKKYLQEMDITELGTAHLFLLDKEGKILVQVAGAPDQNKQKEFLEALK